MEWIRVSIYTDALGREMASGVLMAMGYENLEIVEDEDAVEAVLVETAKYWDYASAKEVVRGMEPCVRVYLAKEENGEENADAIEEALNAFMEENPEFAGAFTFERTIMRDEDWENNWKQYYKPMTLGKRLAVVPDWETYDNSDGRTVITMEPGAAFGTCQHETTSMCLELMDAMEFTGKRVLDVGCGTGILGIAALKLGAKEVLCVDMDPVAVSAARNNAALNDCGDELTCVEGNLADRAEGKYDVILANIVAHVILMLLPQAAPMLAKGGRMIVSGIIKEREEEIIAAAKEVGLVLKNRNSKGEWVALELEQA